MKKIILMVIMVLSVTMISNVKVFASDVTPTEEPSPTPTPEINAFVKFDIVKGNSYSINAMMDYYHNVLNDEQKKIARFLLGSYNFMYMSSRGMSYRNVTDLEDYLNKFNDIADLIFGVDYVESNTSRWSSNFQIFIASIVTYAGKTSYTFDYWLENVAPYLLIPYSDQWLDAWTTFYNDPSNEGVANFGSDVRDWDLGTQYPYLFGDYEFWNATIQSNYISMVTNYAPVMYTDRYNTSQVLVSFKDVPLVDTLYVLRAAQGSGLNKYRFGFYDGSFQNYQMYTYEVSLYDGKMAGSSIAIRGTYDFDIHNLNSMGTLQYVIDEAIKNTPVKFSNDTREFHNWYFGITHVVLVDDLTTLSNRQDVNNDFSLGIITDDTWIKKPKSDLPYWWKPIDFDIEIEKPDGSLDPAGDDDFNQSIVNNTVINNYDVIAPGVVINVPNDWLESDGNYLAYTNDTALPFL